MTTTTGTAVSLTNSDGAFRFVSVSANGGANGIVWNNASQASGSLTVTGTGSAGSGGTIQSMTGVDNAVAGTGIYLNNATNVSLAYMDIEGCQNFGIRGFTVGGFTLDNSTVGVTAKNGTSATADQDADTLLGGEGSIRFNNLTGTATISNSTLDNGFARTVALHNNAAGSTLNLTVTNSTLRESLNNSNGGDPSGNTTDALFLQSSSSATMNLTVTNNSHFTAYRQFAVDTIALGTSTMAINIDHCDFSNSNTGNVTASGSLQLGGNGLSGGDIFVTFNIHDNTFRHGTAGSGSAPTNGGAHLVAGLTSGNGTFYGKFVNNVVGVSGVAHSGAGNAADGLRLFQSGSNGTTHGGTRYLVQGNTIQDYGEVGIQVNSRQDSLSSSSGAPGSIDATVLNNIIREPGTAALGAFAAIWVNAGALAADHNTVNIAIGGTATGDKNTMQDSDPNNATDVFLDQKSCSGCSSAINLYRNGSTASGTGEALIRQILVDDNNPTLDLTNGFTDGSTIGVVVGKPAQAP